MERNYLDPLLEFLTSENVKNSPPYESKRALHEKGIRTTWADEEAIEPIPFGSLADPVSQLAFVMAPSLLRGSKAAIEEIATSRPPSLGMTSRYRIGEKGNLGPVPRGSKGEPLPGSVARNESGELLELHHGTDVPYDDFNLDFAGSGAGGELYGKRGIYMTSEPEIATNYATRKWPREVRDAYEEVKNARYAHQYYADKIKEDPNGSAIYNSIFRQATEELEMAEKNLMEYAELYPELLSKNPAHVRSVYADIKQPFDMDKPLNAADVKRLTTAVRNNPNMSDDVKSIAYETLGRAERRNLTGEEVLKRFIGVSSENYPEFLQLGGYDGITHIGGRVTGGKEHKVYIAFSPDQVYPKYNVLGGK